MKDTPSPYSSNFIRVLTASLSYWQRRTIKLDDDGIVELGHDWRNIYRAIEMGLALPQLCVLASEVALQTFFLAERNGHWGAWTAVYEKALSLGEVIEPRQRGDLMNRLGELYRQVRRIEDAVTIHKQAEALAQKEDDVMALAEARYRLCWDYMQTRQYEEAEVCGHFAIDTFMQFGEHEDLLTNCYWALGGIARRRGELDAAEELLRQAIEMARTTQQPTHRARIVLELGAALTTKKMYDEALTCYDEAEEILAETVSEQDKIMAQMHRATVFYRREQWREAELVWWQAADSIYLQQSGNIYLQGMLAHNLATVLIKMDKLAEAEAQISYALQLRRQLHDRVSIASTMGGLGQVWARQGKRNKAIAIFEEACQILKEYPDDAYACSTLKIIEGELKALEY